MKIAKPANTSVYRGRESCPGCHGKQTGTDTIATSEPWIKFWCDTCRSGFLVATGKISGAFRVQP